MVHSSVCRFCLFVLVGTVLSGFAPGCTGSIGVPAVDVAESDSLAADLGCQCTSDDECLAPIGGACAGSARCIDCLCTVESADSQVCTPEDMCALPGTCQGAICVPAGQKDCDDGDDCTKDSCDPATGCLSEAIPDCPPVVCGDGKCDATETCKQCPGDCGECPVICGDDECTGDESCDSCEEDCGECTEDCGDGECEEDEESCKSCPQDCGQCPVVCDDGECTGDETCKSCPQDCGQCPVVCDDGECSGDETCKSCPDDCGPCPVVCDDGECSGDETCKSCPKDCGDCPAGCGDDKCDVGETCETCPPDCGQCVPKCGDDKCSGDETAVSCHADCAPNWMNMSDPQSHGTVFEKDPAACQTCHLPTLDGGVMSCELCHPKWQANCTFCHGGTDNQTGAPPESVDGQTANTVVEVGAHTMHVTASPMKEAYACASCHAMPADALSDGHVDGGKAETQIETCGLKAVYTAGKCSSVYCHGNGKSTAAGGNATWTGVAMDCDSCHPQAGLGGKHSLHLGMGFSCDTCHGDTVSSKGTISNPEKHVNCIKDVKGTFTYTPGSKTCSNVGCHDSETW